MVFGILGVVQTHLTTSEATVAVEAELDSVVVCADSA